MKKLVLLLALLSVSASDSAHRTRNVTFEEFGTLFLLADKMEKAADEATREAKNSTDNDRVIELRGKASAFSISAAMVGDEIARIRAARRKQTESDGK